MKIKVKMMIMKYVHRIYYVLSKYFKIKEIELKREVNKEFIQLVKLQDGYLGVNQGLGICII